MTGPHSAADLMPVIRRNVAKETAMMTDKGGHYSRLGSDFASHETAYEHGGRPFQRAAEAIGVDI